jgi:hypothetical protein
MWSSTSWPRVRPRVLGVPPRGWLALLASLQGMTWKRRGELAGMDPARQLPTSSTCARPAGYLIPPFHSHYWIGLNTTSYDWPDFSWLDRSPGLDLTSYTHWGTLVRCVVRPGRGSGPGTALAASPCHYYAPACHARRRLTASSPPRLQG